MYRTEYKPDIAIHPGRTLAETIEGLNMSQVDFAKRTDLTPKTINEIIKGVNPITPESAVKFAAVVGTSPTFWNNLQRNYDETVVRLKAERLNKEEMISRVAEIIRKYVPANPWNLATEIAEALVLHPETPCRTAEGFETYEDIRGAIRGVYIKPVQYGGE